MIKSVLIERLDQDGEPFLTGQPPLRLILTNPELSGGFAVLSIDGMGPGKATTYSTEWSTIDGAHADSMHIPARSIVFKLAFIDMFENGKYKKIEDIRRSSYKYFPRKKPVRLTFEMDNGEYYIEGLVESNEPDIFRPDEQTNITVKCLDPYFYDTTSVMDSMTDVVDMFHFEFGIEETPGVPMGEIIKLATKNVVNNSDLEIGMTIKMTASGGDVKNIVAYNETNGNRMQFDCTLHAGQKLIIDTREGHKSIKSSDGKNRINYLNLNSDWLLLEPGDNAIGFNAESGFDNLMISYEYVEKHDGI